MRHFSAWCPMRRLWPPERPPLCEHPLPLPPLLRLELYPLPRELERWLRHRLLYLSKHRPGSDIWTKLMQACDSALRIVLDIMFEERIRPRTCLQKITQRERSESLQRRGSAPEIMRRHVKLLAC